MVSELPESSDNRVRKQGESVYAPISSLLNPDGSVNDQAVSDLVDAVNDHYGIEDLSEDGVDDLQVQEEPDQ